MRRWWKCAEPFLFPSSLSVPFSFFLLQRSLWLWSSCYPPTTTYVPGTTSTQMVPYTIQRYSFFATYWAKFRVVHFGAFYVNLPPAMSQQLQRNTGIVIDLIVKGSPAFFANVLVGDAVIKVNEEDVVDVPGFQNILMRNAGNQVTLTILRGKEQKQISLRLN